MVLHRFRLARLIRARPRIFLITAFALAVGIWLPEGIVHSGTTRWLVAWNIESIGYVLLAALMMIRSTSSRMRHRAQLQDDGERVILLLAGVAAMASLAAIAGELTLVKEFHGFRRTLHIALAGVTVLSSWAFIQVMFTLHYAHDYYAAHCHGRKAGLIFPDEELPDYGDFFYFAAVIGTSGQTADVSFATKPLRRIGTAHCVLSYFFNTTVLALLINIASGLL
jgi:uncharacterized membrane protein